MKKTINLIILVMLVSGCVSPVRRRPELILNPTSAKDYYQRGGYFQDKMEVLRAIPEYTQAIALDQDYTDAYYMRSLCYMCVRDYQGVVADLTRVIEKQPKKPLYYQFRANAYAMLEDVDQALADYDKAISLTAKSCWLYLRKAALLFQEGRFQEAIPAYRGFLRKSPKVINARLSTFLTSGLIGLMTDPTGIIKHSKATVNTREAVKEMVRLCKDIIQRQNLSEATHPITPGMPKRTVLAIVMATDKLITENVYYQSGDSLLVTVSRTGVIDERNIRILLFKRNKLALQKGVALKEVMELPGISKYTDIPRQPTPHRNEVLQALRQTDYILYEDDRQIVSVTEWDTQEGKRVRFFNFDSNDKMTSRITGSRRLW